MPRLDALIRDTLTAFAATLRDPACEVRREHEAKSLYAFGQLAPRCVPGSALTSPAQIALDVPVAQIETERQQALRGTRGRTKRVVAKDLVLWPKPGMTCWCDGDPIHVPLAVMEWKLGLRGLWDYDVEWLTEYSAGRRGFVGYAVTIRERSGHTLVCAARIYDGGVERDWLRVR